MKRVLTTMLAVFGVCALAQPATAAFDTHQCVNHLAREIDPPYRLSVAKASAQCATIAGRAARLSKMIIGTWTMKENGHVARMQFLPDGTLHHHFLSWDTHQMRDRTERWVIDNPYGTVGQESLIIDGGTVTSIKFTGATMTLTSQPASATIVEHWKRAK